MEEVLGMCLDQNQYVFPIKVCSKEVLLETLRSTSVADDVTLIDLKGDGSYIQLLTVYDATHVATDDNVMVVDWKNDESYLQLSTENVTKHTHTVLEHGVQDAKHVKYDTVMLVDWKNNESYLQLSTENVTNHTHIGLEHGMQDAKDVNYHTGILVPEHNCESGKIRKDNFNSNSYAQNDHSANHDELEIITGTVNQAKKAVSKKKCCGFQCKSIPQSLFKFPNVKVMNPSDNIKQYGEWIKNIGNRKLLDKSWSTVYNNYYLCEKHFEDDCFDNVNRTRLKKGAIPTKFDCASLSDSDIAILLGLDFGSCLNQVEQNNLYALKFEMCMNNLDFFCCDGCNEKVLVRGQEKCVHGKNCVDFQATNNMDPGEVPPELKDLSFIEEQLISLIHPVLSVFKLKGLQFGYSGNVINFSQDVSGFARKLPHKVEELPSVMLLKYENDKTDTKYFSVRADKVVKALQWLKVNNKFYSDVEICQENIHLLPENGNVYDRLHANILGDSVEPSMLEEGINGQVNDILLHDSTEAISHHLYETGVPSSIPCTTEEQVQSTILDWPEMNTIPVDEFNTEGYIACAFPTLFCKGYADLRSPRSKKVNPGAYFQHLLNYKDGRFARHTTFRFFALNSWMRWTACTDGSILIKNMPELKNITVCQLNNMLKDDPSLMNRIFYQSSNIRGTKPYWKTRTGELMDMVEELGLPTIFLTLSCADLHWPDLFRVLTGNEDNSKLTEKERRDLLQKNPYIVDSFFHERVECFIETILKPKFKVVDYWYRVEYQHRGSPHIHGVFWFEGAPDVSSISPDNEEKLKEVKAYYDQLITAVNPNPSCECLGVHPCRLLFKDVINKSKEDVEQDLAKLLVKCQRHTKCSEETCLKAKSGGLKKCRFNFPQPLRENSVLFFDEQGVLQYEPARNDPLLNKFLELFMQVWRGNFDISPVTNKQKLIMYLAKYISKSEIRSTSLAELFEKVLGILSDEDNILKVVRKLYISTCSDRDYSAQEVCHILSGRNLYSAGGRLFVNLNLNLEKCVTKVTLDKERIGKSVLEKYECRPSRLDSVSLLNFCKYYNVQNLKYYRRNKYNIVRVFPKLVRKPSDDDNEMFFRQLVLLHVPWRSFNDFQTTDQSWKQLVETHGLSENSNRLQLDPEQIACDHDDDEDADDTDNAFDGLNLEEYMLVSRMGPKNTLPPVLIGLRDSDINHNWSEDASHYLNSISLNELENFIKLKKSEFKNTALNQNVYDPSSYTLSADQQAVVNQLLEQLQCIVENKESNDVPKITIVQGKAGTGKSHLINYLRWKAQEVLKCNNCVYVVGPTGMSALNIGGRTIHSGLHMPTKFPNFELMSGDSLKKFNTSMKNVQFLIIDEYSMVGCRMLRQIDLRLRQAKGVNEPFGNVYVYLLGDIRQLPPVFDTPIYKVPTEPGIAEQGKALVSQVQKVFFLRECFRQKDPAFQAILDRISTGDITQDDYAVLSTRFKNRVGEQERKRFDDAVHFFSVKAKALDHNYKILQELKCTSTQQVAPGVKITAKHNNSVAKSGTAEDAEGLEHTLFLAKGCNIMLTYNLWTEMGLVNGAKGTIVHILFEDGEEPPAGSPKIIMCKFQNYQGPGVGPDNLVPIPTITRFWDKNGTSCSRTQFPLTLFYACSVHKAQGVTETMAYVDIGPKKFHLGIAYVAFSRVKTLDGLLIEPFNFNRLSDLKNNANMKERLKFEAFLEKLSK